MAKEFIRTLILISVCSAAMGVYADVLGGGPCSEKLFSDIVSPLRYPFASYSTTTEDGYILKVFRIQAKNSQIQNGKPVVFLQHGLIDSADNWVINGEAGSLGLVLADAGYDVWLGNSRGNKYSRMHTSISPDSKQFWDYSFQEMGRFDVKANIELALRISGQQKLTFVGHSQGTSQMFAALADPDTAGFVNSKVKKYIALAPVVYLTHQTSALVSLMGKIPLLEQTAQLFGVNEWLPGACSQTSAQSSFQAAVCKVNPLFCNFGLSLFDQNPKYDDLKKLPVYLRHVPSGTSLRTLVHYKQNMLQPDKNSPRFQKFNFGESENLRRYGQKTPPEYNLDLINIPIRGFVGLNDCLGDPTDNTILQNNLQQRGKNYKAYVYNDCGHMTFMWAINSSKIFGDILNEIASS